MLQNIFRYCFKFQRVGLQQILRLLHALAVLIGASKEWVVCPWREWEWLTGMNAVVQKSVTDFIDPG